MNQLLQVMLHPWLTNYTGRLCMTPFRGSVEKFWLADCTPFIPSCVRLNARLPLSLPRSSVMHAGRTSGQKLEASKIISKTRRSSLLRFAPMMWRKQEKLRETTKMYTTCFLLLLFCFLYYRVSVLDALKQFFIPLLRYYYIAGRQFTRDKVVQNHSMYPNGYITSSYAARMMCRASAPDARVQFLK